jgi:hypothetical protein
MIRSSLALAGRTSLFASFPALRTGLLSLSPFLLRPATVARIEKAASRLRRTSRDESSAHTPKPYVDAHGQLSADVIIIGETVHEASVSMIPAARGQEILL